jgi:hypothetical protein
MTGPDQLTCDIITRSCAWQGLNDVDHTAGIIHEPVLQVKFFALHEQELTLNLKKIDTHCIVLFTQLLRFFPKQRTAEVSILVHLRIENRMLSIEYFRKAIFEASTQMNSQFSILNVQLSILN